MSIDAMRSQITINPTTASLMELSTGHRIASMPNVSIAIASFRALENPDAEANGSEIHTRVLIRSQLSVRMLTGE